MKVESKGVAKIQVKATGQIFTITPDELDWDNEGVDEGSMGIEVRHWATVELTCSKSQRSYLVTWQVWEYPIGVENMSETEVDAGLEVLEDFKYYLKHEPDYLNV